MKETESNPYRVDAACMETAWDGVSDETLRRRYIVEEVKIVAVGWFYYCMASFQVGLLAGLFVFPHWKDQNFLYAAVALLTVTAGVYAFIGYGLRHFLGWARLPSKFAAIVGMCMIPVGTFAGIYCLFLLNRSTSIEMFEPRYQRLVAREQYLKYAWCAVVVGLLLAVTFWAFFWLIGWQTIDLREIRFSK